LLPKDQATKSGMASPFLHQGFWKGKEDSEVAMLKSPNDEFMEMYQFNTESHRLTNMFAIDNNHINDDKSTNQMLKGFKKVSNSNAPLLPLEITCFNNNVVKNDRESSDDEDEDDITSQRGNGKRKFNKGLKLLSVIVKDIVVQKQVTTYKEVADIILKDTIKFENLNLNSKLEVAKEEQNIKRRVYDALNVLIAAGILIKEGKLVRKNTNNKKIIVNLKRLDANTYSSKIVT